MLRANAVLAVLAVATSAVAQVPAPRSFLATEYGHTRFSTDFDPWHLASVEAGHRFERSTLVVRVTYGHRFNESGWQVEADGYPVFDARTYAWLNAGVGLRGAFPDVRLGAELYRGLPHGWEASAGLRHLQFPGTDVTMYTGSLAKYRGAWWVAARPFLVLSTPGTSFTGVLAARRYLGSGDAFVGLQGSLGSAPVEVITVADFLRTRGLGLRAEGQHHLQSRWWGGWFVGWDRETLPGRTRHRYTLGVRALHRF